MAIMGMCFWVGAFAVPNGQRGFQSVELRHFEIHQDHVKGACFQLLQRPLAVLGDHHGMAVFFQQAHRQFLVHKAVFRQEHAQRWQAAGRVGRGRSETCWRCGRPSQGDADGVQ